MNDACSIGVSFAKTLAKIGSDCNKPDGITILAPENYQDILAPKKITCIPGIGKKTKIYYLKRGYQTIGDIFKRDLPYIRTHLGENGVWVWYRAHGLDKRKVHSDKGNYNPKSISKERTFSADVTDMKEVIEKMSEL